MRALAAALVGLLFLLGAPLADADAQLSAGAMQHILARHGPQSTAKDAGHFAPGTTPEAIRALVGEAVAKGAPHPDTEGRSGTLYDYSFPDTIGVTAEGHPTHRLRVVVGHEGQVVTAYPR
jgi:hypothetical protein